MTPAQVIDTLRAELHSHNSIYTDMLAPTHLLLSFITLMITSAWSAPVISEFMASNKQTLADEDGDYSDWIEIHNPDDVVVNLAGWYLSDSADNLTKWTFPNVSLNPNQRLVVFASGKNRAAAGAELHTNFKLSSGGEYLALVNSDGSTKASEFAPSFPEQLSDFSYGFAGETSILIDRDSAIKYRIPSDANLATLWTHQAFDDSDWSASEPTTLNVASTDVSKNTQQSGSISSNLNVSSSALIQDINVTLNISHANDSDLSVTLRSPQGTTITLFANEGGSGNNFSGTTLDDEANTAIENAGAPFGGNYRPTGSLAAFDGQDAAGTWVLSVTDGGRNFFPNTGTLNSWSINITTAGGSTLLKQGIGFEDNPSNGVNFSDELSTILPSGTVSNYVRIPFTANNVAAIDSLILKMKYDDGFIAYLNGIKLAEANAPATPIWSSTATAGHVDGDALQFVSYDISASSAALLEGQNVLAIHMLNQNATSTDFLMSTELIASQTLDYATAAAGFLSAPTPGAANNASSRNTGPYISDVTEPLQELSESAPLVITARLGQKTDPVADATLHYLVNFQDQVEISMNDLGTGGDITAGDGVWSATIPASAFSAGDMLRWFVRANDTAGHSTREPLGVDPLAAQYYGIPISDGIITNGIGRFRWWVENPDWYWTGAVGSSNIQKEYTTCSLWYEGQFYDNVRVRTRGASSVYGEYPKQSLHFNFHSSKRFQWLEGEAGMDRVNLNNIWVDQAYLRNDLSQKLFAASGVTAPASRMVVVHQFGNDPTVSNLVEHPNAEFLERQGLDPDGAFYKVYNRLEDAAVRPEWTPGVSPNSLVGVEKKTREDENNDDLQSFIDILNDSNPSRQIDLLDQVNLPKVINYMASSVIDQGLDVFAKNHYVYRDTNGSGEWEMIPWDRDVSWGPSKWNTNSIIYSSSSKSHPLFGSGINGGERYPLFEAIIDEPLTRQLFLRRLRSLMDEQLQSPITVPAELKLEAAISEFVSHSARINTPAGESDNWVQHDKDIWSKLRATQSDSQLQTFTESISAITDDYLPNRRTYLFDTMGPDGEGLIPALQSSLPQVVIGNVEYNPASGDQDEEFIEIINLETEAVDISGWTISDGVEHTFMAGTVIPAYDAANPEANRIFLVPDSAVFRARAASPTGAESRLVQEGYSGHLSSFGETLVLTNTDNAIVDSTSFEGTPSEEQLYLAVSEIMYHPSVNGEAEFVELTNTSDTETLDLAGVEFTNGITFSFSGSSITQLAPGEMVLVVKDINAFESIYGTGLPVAGAWSGSLNNDGETIKLEDASSSTIKEFTYNDASPWPLSADGQGSSLVLISVMSNPDPDLANHWRASKFAGGTPASTTAIPNLPAQPLTDANNNGVADLVDYGLAARPKISNSLIDNGDGLQLYPTLEFKLRPESERVTTQLEYSTNMVDWSDEPSNLRLVSETLNSDGTISYRWQSIYPTSDKQQQFLRLVVKAR